MIAWKVSIFVVLAAAVVPGTFSIEKIEEDIQVMRAQRASNNVQEALRGCVRELEKLKKTVCYGLGAMLTSHTETSQIENFLGRWPSGGNSRSVAISENEDTYGFIKECCFNSCTIHQILEYC